MTPSLITRLCPVARPVRPRCAVPPKAAARPERRWQMTIFPRHVLRITKTWRNTEQHHRAPAHDQLRRRTEETAAEASSGETQKFRISGTENGADILPSPI